MLIMTWQVSHCAACCQGHALGRLLVYDVEHDRVPTEQQRIIAVERVRCARCAVLWRAVLFLTGAGSHQ